MRRLQTKFISDISRYTENFFLGMSPRQTICGLAGGIIMASGAWLWPVPDILPMLAGFALIALGFFRPDGLPPEKYLRAWVEARFVNPPARYYQQDNIPYEFLWEGRICGRVCFRPQDYLKKEDKELQTIHTESAPAAQTLDADWPEPEAPKEELQPDAPAAQAQAPPQKPAPPATGKTPARKAPAKPASGKAKARMAARKTSPPPVAPETLLPPRQAPRIPAYAVRPEAKKGGRR